MEIDSEFTLVSVLFCSSFPPPATPPQLIMFVFFSLISPYLNSFFPSLPTVISVLQIIHCLHVAAALSEC